MARRCEQIVLFFVVPQNFCFFLCLIQLGFCVYLRSDLNESGEASTWSRTSFLR